MDANLLITLQNYGLSEKEAKVYLTVLELGSSIASTIARRAELNRVTTYTLLEDLKRDGIVNETTKEGIKYYSVISPDILLKQLEQKYESFKEKVPELLAMAEKFGSKPKVQFFEGLEGIKKLYRQVLFEGEKMDEPYLAFVGTTDMDPRFEKWLTTEFKDIRKKIKTPTRVIQSTSEKNNEYLSFHRDNYSILVIGDPLFEFSNEIVLYANNKVALMMYSKNELCGLVIESHTLYK
jgi:sugar-specific transcriptional regulator TrmB